MSLFYRTALSIAIEKGDIEIIKLLLSNPNIDPNIKLIKTHFILFYSTYLFHEVQIFKYFI